MTSVMPGLLPDTNCIQFTARPALRTRDNSRNATARIGRSSSVDSVAESTILSPNSSLSSIEIEALLREKVRAKSDSIIQAFEAYDVGQTSSVTKGEFRRVIEAFCTPLTTDQFEAVLAKVDKNPNGTVRYTDFLNKFHSNPNGISTGGLRQTHKISNGVPKFVSPPTPTEINVDMIEKLLKEKIETNMKSVVKGLQLFDYNRDGRIQRHEMRRVIENYCFKLSDQQYDKLWQRYDFHHTGMVNYKDFLARLGVSMQMLKPQQDGSKAALNWQQNTPSPHQRNFKQRQEDEEMLRTMSFREIEIEFRRRMKENYVNLKKAFMSFDRGLDGFVSLENLQAILTQFTLPMSTQLFSQIMDKCGVRATGRIAWEEFLERFQDPVTLGNGQTLPIKPGHKFFPVKEGIQTLEVDDIWKMLYKHVNSNYGSFKQAFLQFDINRKGKVSRVELKNILEKFHIRLQDDQFKQLMEKIDPFHSNDISYHKFLELFEERDGPEGHKWLNSVHKVNEHTKPAIMAWETIEELLQEKITEYWKNVSSALLAYDYKGDNHVSHTNLKKVLDNYVLPVSNEHLQSMINRCSDKTDSHVNYIEFLEKLNVDVKPGDLQGLSTQIFDGSNDREMKRLDDLNYRNQKITSIALGRMNEMTADEVIIRIKDRIAQHSQEFRQAFLRYDKYGKGVVSKRDFRQVLSSFGMTMLDEQFNILVSKLNFNDKGYMQYSDFIVSFYDPRHGGPGEDIQRTGNHHVNPIRGDQFGMSLEEVERKLASKLRENFANLRGAFYKFDENHTGSLTKENFRRLLDSCMCFLSDEQFEEFCNKNGITKHSRISYAEFLDRFEVRDTVEGHKWLNSVHRFNEVQPTPELSAIDAFEMIKRKAHQQFKDLAQAFIKIGTKTSGVLKRRDLRQLLLTFVMPVNDEEFSKLWKMFDKENVGYIRFETFLDKIGAGEFTPGDMFGFSSKIIDESKRFLNDHNEEQLMKHERITQIQANRAGFMTVEEVEQALKDKIRDNYDDFYKAFRKYDTGKKGSLSITEVQKVLIDFNLFLDDDQFFALLDRCGLTTKKSRINYEQFLAVFEEGRKSSYGPRKKDVYIEEQPNLTNPEAEHKLRELVASQMEILERAFGAFDKDHSSRIPLADFRRVLDLFCFKLSDQQWKHIQPKLNITGDKVNYSLFLDSYTMSEQEDSDRWMASLQKAFRSQTPHLMPIDEVEERLREAVKANSHMLTQAFTEADYASLGVVSKDDFRTIIDKNVFRLSDEQYEKLWTSVCVNEFGNINYLDFIKRFSCDPSPPKPPPISLQRANTTLNKRPESMAMRRSMTKLDFPRPGAMSRSYTRLSTPMVNAESAENVVKNTIYRNWKNIQQMCRQKDIINSGTINVVDLKEILVKYGVDLSNEEFLNLLTKYDLKENGSFCYSDFLRHFILNLKPMEEPKSLLTRRRLQTPKIVKSAGTTSVQFFDAMMRLRESVTTNWKEMRRMFRMYDAAGTGLVESTDFRQVLRQFSVNLDEDEFYYLLSYYDKNMDGKISYNDFIRAYLDKA